MPDMKYCLIYVNTNVYIYLLGEDVQHKSLNC